MKFVKRTVERLTFLNHESALVYQYVSEDGVIYQKMGLGWFDVHGKRLVGDISHLSKAADDFELGIYSE